MENKWYEMRLQSSSIILCDNRYDIELIVEKLKNHGYKPRKDMNGNGNSYCVVNDKNRFLIANIKGNLSCYTTGQRFDNIIYAFDIKLILYDLIKYAHRTIFPCLKQYGKQFVFDIEEEKLVELSDNWYLDLINNKEN
jgi:hypothetical protein